MKKIKAFKVFENDWTCRGFQYGVGKEYFQEGKIKLCENGFHACSNLADCFNYYPFNPNNKVAEVELYGSIDSDDGDKICASNIKILSELSWDFVLKTCNSGDYNSGYRNSGNYNSGDFNSGYRNSGYRNSGNYNSGYRNSGDFNTKTFYFLFNKPIENMNYEKPKFFFCINLNIWVNENCMSEQEKINNPNFYINGGYLKTISYKEAWKNAWDIAKTKKDFKSEYNKLINIPNFDKDIFKEITGIDIDE